MKKWKASVLIAAATVFSLAQTANEYESPEVVRIAGKLNCNCGCKLRMDCVMPPTGICPVCKTAKIRIASMKQGGQSDQQILAAFAAERPDAIAVPPGPFGTAAPYIAIVLGLGIVAWAIRRYLRMRPAPAVPAGDDEALSRYHEQIEKDLAKLE